MLKKCLLCDSVLKKSEKYVCDECNYKIKLLKQIEKVDSATEKMSKAYKTVYYQDVDYKMEREEVVCKILDEDYRFASTDEICMALALEKECINYVPNFKIGMYCVDFYLPNEHLIIEIDGERHNEEKDFIRDRYLMQVFGENYEIIRIKTTIMPYCILGDLDKKFKYILERRKDNQKFRDARFDSNYLKEYMQLESLENKRKKGHRENNDYKGIFKSSKQIE